MEVFVPAVGQGCVAVECRTDDAVTRAAASAVDHPATRHAVTVERAFLAELGSGCTLPVGAHVMAGRLWTFLADLDAGTSVRDDMELSGSLADLDLDVDLARHAARASQTALG